MVGVGGGERRARITYRLRRLEAKLIATKHPQRRMAMEKMGTMAMGTKTMTLRLTLLRWRRR